MHSLDNLPDGVDGESTWVVVKIMVPFGVLNYPKRGHNFDNYPHAKLSSKLQRRRHRPLTSLRPLSQTLTPNTLAMEPLLWNPNGLILVVQRVAKVKISNPQVEFKPKDDPTKLLQNLVTNWALRNLPFQGSLI